MPTFLRMSMDLARSSFLSFMPWARRPSSICHPMVYTGLSTELGSWNTMAAWRRAFRELFAGQRQHLQPLGARAVRQATAPEVERSPAAADEGACGHGLAGTGLAHHADDLLTGNFEAILSDGFDGTGVGQNETLRSLISARLPSLISLIGSLPFLGSPFGSHE